MPALPAKRNLIPICKPVSELPYDEAVAGEAPFEDFGRLFGGQGAFDRLLRAFFTEEGYAAAAARAADLRGERAASERSLDEALHVRRRHVRREALAVRVRVAHDRADAR